jgi:hypothetical protein
VQFDKVQFDKTRARFFAVLRNRQKSAGNLAGLVFDLALERTDDGLNREFVAREVVDGVALDNGIIGGVSACIFNWPGLRKGGADSKKRHDSRKYDLMFHQSSPASSR